MLLALDVGNSSISMGIFSVDKSDLLYTFELATEKNRSADEYMVQICAMLHFYNINEKEIKSAIVSSVVPNLTDTIRKAVEKIVNTEAKLVGPGLKTGFSIKIDNPSELGSDLVANTAAALHLTKGGKRPIIVIDMGTATTISAVTANGEYIGNSIIPGIKLSLESLQEQTELIPTITPLSPRNVIGKNSTDSVRSGMIFGNAFMIDAFVDEYIKEMKVNPTQCIVYMTGGFSGMVMPYLTHKVVHEPHLTLKGLYYIYKKI